MISFLKGKIEAVTLNSLQIDVNGVGYEVHVSNPEYYHIDGEIKIYTYYHVREDEISLYGFKDKEEKEVFLNLINVKGVGVKSAISMLSKTTPSMLVQAIETGNIGYLKKLPGVGPKVAQQIILDLKGHLRLDYKEQTVKTSPVLKEAKEALKSLNFKVQEIDEALSKINDENISVDVCVLKALQYLNKK